MQNARSFSTGKPAKESLVAGGVTVAWRQVLGATLARCTALTVCAALPVFGLTACRSRDPLALGPSATSPQAATEPVPLEHAPARGEDAKARSPSETQADPDAGSETAFADGVVFTYDMQLGEGSFAARMGDTSSVQLELLRRRSGTTVRILTSAARTSVSVEGPRSFFPAGLEARSQADTRGFTLVDAREKRFTDAPSGAWRALFSDGRTDAAPLRPVDAASLPVPGPERERTVTLATKVTTLGLLVAATGDDSAAGEIVARMFAELAGMNPHGPLLRDGEHVKRADFQWSNGRKFRLALTARLAKTVESADLLAVPPGYQRRRDLLPAPTSRAFLSPAEMGSLRGAVPEGPPGGGSTLWLVNRDLAPRIALLEGIPVGLLGGNQSLALEGLRPGRYAIRWLSPLGELDSGDGVAEVPGVVTVPLSGSP